MCPHNHSTGFPGLSISVFVELPLGEPLQLNVLALSRLEYHPLRAELEDRPRRVRWRGHALTGTMQNQVTCVRGIPTCLARVVDVNTDKAHFLGMFVGAQPSLGANPRLDKDK